MSHEDDDLTSGPSLKDLVTTTLQSNGVLGKIQAQLRASIFLTLEEEFKEKNHPLINTKARELLSTPVGIYAATLVKDFLECLDLDFTLSVYEPESNLSSHIDDSNKNHVFNGETSSSKTQIGERKPLLFNLIEESQAIKHNGYNGLLGENLVNKTYDIDSEKEARTVEDTDSNQSELNASKLMNEALIDVDDSINEEYKDDFSSHTQNRDDDIPDDNLEKDQSPIETESEESTKTIENKSTDILSNQNSDSSNKGSENQNSKDGNQEEEEEEDAASLSGVKDLPGDEAIVQNQTQVEADAPETDTKEHVEDAAEPDEDIDEDIYMDDLLSSSTTDSIATKDATESQATISVDYVESL